MARACTLCTHPDRASIDEALVAGEPNRRVASRVGTSEASVRRHRDHLPGTLALAHEAREVTRADDLLGILREAVKDARRLRDKAEAEKDYRCAVAAVKVLTDVVEKLATVAERLRETADEPRTLAELMTKIAKKREAQLAALARLEPAAPLTVEWVNDWRPPLVAPPGGPAA